VRREPEADRGVAEERQCQQQSDAQVAETKGDEVQDEDD